MAMPALDDVLAATYLALAQNQRGDYEMVLRALKAAIKAAALQGLSVGATALTHVNYLTTVLTPWITAYSVASGAQTTMDLYDLLPTREGGKNLYTCSCGRCLGAIRFAINNREVNVAKKAISATVVGMPFVMLYSAGRNVYKWSKGTKGVEREAHSRQLQTSALPLARTRKVRTAPQRFETRTEVLRAGCPKAQAAIAILMGELAVDTPNQSPLAYQKTIAAVTAMSGWQEIKKTMYAGPF